MAKAPKAETEAEAAPSATDVLAAATAPVDDHTLTREGSRSIAALLEGADDEEAARKLEALRLELEAAEAARKAAEEEAARLAEEAAKAAEEEARR